MATMEPGSSGPAIVADRAERLVREQDEARKKALLLEDELARKFQPGKDRMVVRRSTVKETAGGIVLPDTQKQRPVTGTVVCIGPEVSDYEVGDVVLFMAYAGVELEAKNGAKLESHIVCTQDEIFGRWLIDAD